MFACATYMASAKGRTGYATTVVAETAGPVQSGSGIAIVADAGIQDDLGEVDTLVVVGGPGIVACATNSPSVRFVATLAARVRRVASVCTGAFLLGAAGLLDGRRAVTHWQYAEAFSNAFPSAILDRDAIYTKDGPVYTSAGVTAGMDLALALVESDLGRTTSMQVARYLVMFLHRSGRQSQLSVQLSGQSAKSEPLDATQAYVLEHLTADLSVEALAARVGMSPRNFARVFRQKLGMTPAVFVERARLDASRRLLEQTTLGIEEIARASGFALAETLRRVFARNLATSPTAYRRACALRGA